MPRIRTIKPEIATIQDRERPALAAPIPGSHRRKTLALTTCASASIWRQCCPSPETARPRPFGCIFGPAVFPAGALRSVRPFRFPWRNFVAPIFAGYQPMVPKKVSRNSPESPDKQLTPIFANSRESSRGRARSKSYRVSSPEEGKRYDTTRTGQLKHCPCGRSSYRRYGV